MKANLVFSQGCTSTYCLRYTQLDSVLTHSSSCWSKGAIIIRGLGAPRFLANMRIINVYLPKMCILLLKSSLAVINESCHVTFSLTKMGYVHIKVGVVMPKFLHTPSAQSSAHTSYPYQATSPVSTELFNVREKHGRSWEIISRDKRHSKDVCTRRPICLHSYRRRFCHVTLSLRLSLFSRTC